MIEEERTQGFIDSGEHWKAKELLQGRLSSSGYDSDLFEAYGNVLLAMNDSLEAGKYLFLSGVRKFEYEKSIELYLDRFSKSNVQHIHDTFPKKAQSSPYQEYPEVVKNELDELGYKPRGTNGELDKDGKSKALTDRATELSFIALCLLLVVGFFVGALSGLMILWDWIFF